MNVANIMPGDEVKVELKYTELLVPTDGIYEFVYPTVVGPRYSNRKEALASSSDTWVKNPYLHEGEPPTYSFDIAVTLPRLPIKELLSSSHKVKTNYTSLLLQKVILTDRIKTVETAITFSVIAFRRQVAIGLCSSRRKREFFLLMVQPPKKIVNDQIPNREYFSLSMFPVP
jgi:Ca-activated chloride channel family protein